MTKELIEKFWKEFPIPTQDEDPKFPYANPSDAARALIKAHNWVGTITEALIKQSENLKELKNTLFSLDTKVEKMERLIFIKNPPPSWATKSKDMQKTYVWSQAEPSDLELFEVMEDSKVTLKGQIFGIEKDIDLYNLMLKTLERSCDWLISYINWTKFELRMDNS